ncbi:MAG: uracil-DNA glycosylase [Halobacteriota archaeon]
MYEEQELRRQEAGIAECRLCELWNTRNKPVFGEGALSARIMLIGEAPGYYEDLHGRPFVGKAGKVLDELLNSIGLVRAEVYITNILKCRPPGNRNPAVAEIKACTPYLDAQMRIIDPDVIVTLGNFSLTYIFDKLGLKPEKISKIHGKVFTVSTITGIKRLTPLYHPAVATYNPGMKTVLLTDFKALKDFV